MDSLAHWDYAVQFSGYQAAALILGIDPGKPESPQSNESPVIAVYERLALHYGHALTRHYHGAFRTCSDDEQEMQANIAFELPSATLSKLSESWERDQDEPWAQESHAFTEWLLDGQRHDFGCQSFSREALVKWLRATGLESVYQFNIDELGSGVRSVGYWPWGDHSTKALEHLEAAAKRFWTGYDPTDPATAKTNQVIVNWLIEERNVTGKMAESIATLLRADGLRTGPR